MPEHKIRRIQNLPAGTKILIEVQNLPRSHLGIIIPFLFQKKLRAGLPEPIDALLYISNHENITGLRRPSLIVRLRFGKPCHAV